MSKYLVFSWSGHRADLPDELLGTAREDQLPVEEESGSDFRLTLTKEKVQLPKAFLRGREEEMLVYRSHTVRDENGKAKGTLHPEGGTPIVAYYRILGT